MAVITLSRQYGSGGDEIATWLSDKLQYPLFDKTLIDQAAAQAGLLQKEVLDFSEENHKITTFLDRLLNRVSVSTYARSWEYPEMIETPIEEPLDESTMLQLVQKAVTTACDTGNIIIVGRGSQAILKDKTGVIHVRVIAPLEDRIQRVKDLIKRTNQIYRADLETRREAQDVITNRDLISADYIKRFYGEDWGDPLLYTLVVNTGTMTIEQAGKLVLDLVQG